MVLVVVKEEYIDPGVSHGAECVSTERVHAAIGRRINTEMSTAFRVLNNLVDRFMGVFTLDIEQEFAREGYLLQPLVDSTLKGI
ncbi:MAG: hypothetical protein PVG32_07775 [Anaerolineales bacterium]|jgi:hypothetical protein